jgi:hypothetical protein
MRLLIAFQRCIFGTIQYCSEGPPPNKIGQIDKVPGILSTPSLDLTRSKIQEGVTDVYVPTQSRRTQSAITTTTTLRANIPSFFSLNIKLRIQTRERPQHPSEHDS